MTEDSPQFQETNKKAEYELGRNDLLLRAAPVNAFIDILQHHGNLNPPSRGEAFFSKYNGRGEQSAYANGTDNIGVFLVFPEESGRLPLKDQQGSIYGNETVTKPGTEIPPDMWVFIKPTELEIIKDCKSRQTALEKLASRSEVESQSLQEARKLIALRKELSRLEGIFDNQEIEDYNMHIRESGSSEDYIDVRFGRTHYAKFYENLPEVEKRIKLYKKMIKFLEGNQQRAAGHRDRYLIDESHGLYSVKEALTWDEPKLILSTEKLKSSFEAIKAIDFEGDSAHFESLRGMVQNNDILRYIFGVDFGAGGKHIDHSIAVMSQGEHQIASGLNRLGIVSDPSKFLRATLFTHDVGKVLALDIDKCSHAQHQYADIVEEEVLPGWGFSDRDIAIAKAIWGQNIIGEFFEGVISPQEAGRKLEEVAGSLKLTPEERAEFWRLLEASYICDASSYKTYSYLFENNDASGNTLVFSNYAEKRIGSVRSSFLR